MGCVLDMTVPPDVLLNQLHSYGNRLTTSSVADTDATDPHFLVDSGASIHLISQSTCGFARSGPPMNGAPQPCSGQEMILDRCVEAEFSTYALRSRHVSFLECDGAAASSPDAASSAAASSKAAAPPPAAPASSSLSPVSRSICAGIQLQRPQKLKFTALIGYGQVSLLSVALLASKGWTFTCSLGKSGSRTSREVDKPAKPPCLSLSHFGGHDQVPTRTRSGRTHLDIFLWCNVPWISIVHPGAIDIDMSSSIRSLQYTSDVDSSSNRVVRYSTMHNAVRDSVLHVAERDGSSSVHERIDCADPVQPRWSMPSDAWVDTMELSGEKKKEQSPNTVMEEPAEPTPGTVIAQVGQQDVERGSSEPREGTASETEVKGTTAPEEGARRVVLVTMEPEKSTEVIVKPMEPAEKEKEPEKLPEPEIPEKPFETAKSPGKAEETPTDPEKAPEGTAEQEVAFKMKSWSAWLRRQDEKEETRRVRNRERQRALRRQRREERAEGRRQAICKGPSIKRAYTIEREDLIPKGSVRKVLKKDTKPPRMERTVKLSLVEREVQASRVTAKGEYMAQNRHRAWIAPKRRPRPGASESRVKKEFVEIKPSRGVTMVSLTASEASDLGDMEEVPETTPPPSEAPRSRQSSGLTGAERVTSETIIRIGATPEGEVVAKKQEIKPGTAFFMKRRPIPGQVTDETSRQLSSKRDRCQYFRMDVGDRSSS